jgi:HEAT repeat protein
MERRKYLARVGLLFAALLLFGGALSAADKETDPDVKCLKLGKLATDDENLLAYLRDRAKVATDPARLPDLIRQLGSPDFDQREEASNRLVALAEKAVPILRQNVNHEDAEIASRARGCLERIEKNGQMYLAPPVVRVLVRRRPAGTLETLLAYLPVAADPEVEADIYYGLDALAVHDGRLAPALVAALKDGQPARRAVAACIVGRAGTAEQKEAVRKLLADKDAAVRLRAAQGLLAGHDAAGVPALVRLLEEGTLELAWQAEELLHWLAADEAPGEVVGAGSAEQRRASLAGWEKWQKKSGNSIDWEALEQAPRRPGLFAVEEGIPVPGKKTYDKDGLDTRVRLHGCDGRVRHEFKTPKVMTVWRCCPDGGLITSSLLPGGDKERWIEQDASGRVLWQTTFPPPFPRWSDVKRLPSGEVVAFSPSGILTLDTQGQQVRRARLGFWPRAQRASLQLPWPRAGFVCEWHSVKQEDHLTLQEFDLRTGDALASHPLNAVGQERSLLLLADAGGGNLLLAHAAPAVNEVEHYQLLELDGESRVLRRTVLPGDACPAAVAEWARPGRWAERLWLGPALGLAGRTRWGRAPRWEIAGLNLVAQVQEVSPLVHLGWTWPHTAAADLNGPAYRLRQVRSKSVLERRCGAHRLKALKLSDAELRQALASLCDPDLEVRQALMEVALDAGGRLGRDAIPNVIEVSADERRHLSYEAAQVLEKLGPASIPALIAVVADLKQPARKRGWVVGTLAHWLEDKRAAEVVRGALRDQSRDVQKSAIAGICEQEEAARGWVPEIVPFLKSRDPDLAQATAFALGNLGPVADQAIPALLEALQDDSKSHAAFLVLDDIGRRTPAIFRRNPAFLATLVKLLDAKQQPRTRAEAAGVLSRLGPAAKDAVPALITMLQEKPTAESMNNGLHYSGVAALGAIGPSAKAAVPMLLSIVKQTSQDAATRQAAITSLGGIGPDAKDVVPELLALVQNTTTFTDPLVLPAMTALTAIDPKAGQEAKKVWAAKYDEWFPPPPGGRIRQP